MNPIRPLVMLVSRTSPALVFGLLIVACQTTLAQEDFADNWPNFRGPTYNGTSTTASPPSTWSEDKNVKWKIELPGSGNNSSPIVWGDKVFVLTAIPSAPAAGDDTAPKAKESPRRGRGGRRGGRRQQAPPTSTKFVTLCLDRATGETLWEQVAVEMTPHQGTHNDHSFASASPCTDGKHIYSHFGSRGLYCYDMDGELKWKRDDLGQMMTRNGFGEGSSPFLYKDSIVVPWDHEGQSFVMVLDALTGETRWKKDRDEPSNWVTPIVVEHGDKAIVVTGGDNLARGYDLETGDELWHSSGLTSRPISCPVAFEDMVYLGSARGGFFLGAFRLGGEGNLNENDGVAWSTAGTKDPGPDVPSMMLSDDRIFFLSGSTNILNCVDARTGEAVFRQERLDGVSGVYASPVAGGGKVIIVGRDGAAIVIEDSSEYKVIAENKLDDSIDATPALAGNQMFLRGKKYLYCIEE